MVAKRKILLIENQVKQFEKIHKALDMYEVFPAHDNNEKEAEREDQEYLAIMDRIRIYLTNTYSDDRKKEAINYLRDYIIANQIEVYIIDLILLGTSEGGNGISLATRLQSDEVLEILPIVFLSGNPRHMENIETELKGVTRYDWVEKGYGGVNLNQPAYLKNHLVPVIEQLLGISPFDATTAHIDKLLSLPDLYANYLQLFKDIKKRGQVAKAYDQAETELVADLATIDYEDFKIKKKIDAYKKSIAKKS
jgi:hypothetical protein